MPTDYHNSFNLGEEVIWEPDVNYPLSYLIDRGDYWAWNNTYTSWLRNGGSSSGTARGSNLGKLFRMDNRTLVLLVGCGAAGAIAGINKANLGLANLDKMVNATQEERNLIAGQLYFFRGWFHFMIMQYWGGLPYIDKVLTTNDRLPRLSYQATAEKAAEDFRRAADLLPVDWDATKAGQATMGNNNIRINKVMALGYLGKDLLWAGSPLMNYESTGSKSYNRDLCKRAADAFAEALEICESTGRYQLADFSQWSDLFYTHNQNGRLPGLKEAIFYENLRETSSRWRWNMVNDFRPQLINASGVKCWPTANYVDYYGMANGMPINDITKKDAESGYDPEYPWKGRDPRFYKDIIFDGVKCCTNGKGDMKETKQYASLYTGGSYRVDTKGCLTGYMNTKFCPQLTNDYDGYRENNCMVLSFMRLADVYLMYAEATAQGYGSPTSKVNGYGLSAADAVNKVRDRAGVGHVADKFLASLDGFMSELRRERAVELAFEGHRFVDLRRWMLLTERPYTLKKAVFFDRDPKGVDYDNPQDAHVLNTREEILFERKYQDRHYWLPFLRDDVMMYESFGQNPGWN